jgi:hypothetical protein
LKISDNAPYPSSGIGRNYSPPEGSVLRPAGGFLRKADDCPKRSGSCQSSQGKLHFPCAGCRQLPLCGLAARNPFAAANCSRPEGFRSSPSIEDGHSIIESATNAHLKNFLKIILIGITICLDIDDFIRLEKTILKFYINTMQERIPSSKVIYMRRTGEYDVENYKLMDTFKKWIKENNLYDEDTVFYAIPMDNPEIVKPCQCCYDVCINYPHPESQLCTKSNQV